MYSDISYSAMMFARTVHRSQRRKYTNAPYFDHLAEVAGIVATVAKDDKEISADVIVASAWLHDCMEDQDVSPQHLKDFFGSDVMEGVIYLTDKEVGNRAQRKAAARMRLSGTPSWVQTIKCADLISNTSSIVEYDPKFAVVYLREKRLLLEVMTAADPRLRLLAYDVLTAAETRLQADALSIGQPGESAGEATNTGFPGESPKS